VNVKRKNKSVSSWKRNKVFKNDARSTKHKEVYQSLLQTVAYATQMSMCGFNGYLV